MDFCQRCGPQAPVSHHITQKPGPNHGRPYYKCMRCYNFLSWADESSMPQDSVHQHSMLQQKLDRMEKMLEDVVSWIKERKDEEV